MDRKDLATSPNDAEKTSFADPEKTVVAPLFDEAAVQHARPAEPLRMPRYRRSWPLAIALMAVTAGLIGGIIGGVMTALYQRQPLVAASNRQTPDTTANENQVAQPPQQQTATVHTSAPATPADEPRAAQASAPATVGDDLKGPEEKNEGDANKASAKQNGAGESAAGRSERAEARQSSPVATQVAAGRDGAHAEPQSARPALADRDSAPPEETQAALRGALNEWLAATNSRDIERQMKFYGRSVNAFYLSRNASREAVRAEKARVFGSANVVDVQAGTPEIKLSPDGSTATMRFRKRYQIEGQSGGRRGEVLQELRWRRTGDGWRIVSERDLRVIN